MQQAKNVALPEKQGRRCSGADTASVPFAACAMCTVLSLVLNTINVHHLLRIVGYLNRNFPHSTKNISPFPNMDDKSTDV